MTIDSLVVAINKYKYSKMEIEKHKKGPDLKKGVSTTRNKLHTRLKEYCPPPLHHASLPGDKKWARKELV